MLLFTAAIFFATIEDTGRELFEYSYFVLMSCDCNLDSYILITKPFPRSLQSQSKSQKKSLM